MFVLTISSREDVAFLEKENSRKHLSTDLPDAKSAAFSFLLRRNFFECYIESTSVYRELFLPLMNDRRVTTTWDQQ